MNSQDRRSHHTKARHRHSGGLRPLKAQRAALALSTACALTLLLGLVGHATNADADDVEHIFFSNGQAKVLAQEPDAQVRAIDLTTGRTLDQTILIDEGDTWHLSALPDVTVISSNAPVEVTAGAPGLVGGWSSFIPDLNGRWRGREFLTRVEGDLLLTVAHTSPAPVEVQIVDLDDNTPPLTLTEADAIANTRRHTVFRLDDFDGQRLHITLSQPGVLQTISDLDTRSGWITAPPSTEPGEDGVGVLSTGIVAVESAMLILPLYHDTEIELIDLSDGDDSGTWTLSPGLMLSTVTLPGPLAVGWTATFTDSPMDRDVIEIRASRPVAVITGAFELLPRRGGVNHSTPAGPDRHMAIMAVEPGRMHVLSRWPSQIAMQPLAARGQLAAVTTLGPNQWRGEGPTRAAVDVVQEQLFRVEADAPFILMTEPDTPGACCGPHKIPTLPSDTSLPPVAEAGPRIKTCPREPFTLSGADSYDPDTLGEAPDVVAHQWDLDLDRNSDNEGQRDDDIDADTPTVEHAFANSGFYRARLTVTDNEGQRDFDEVEIQVRVPADPQCGGDPDEDALGSFIDNCPEIANPDQADLDNDGIGDDCDPDIDGDNIDNVPDTCPRLNDPDQSDNDGDGLGDACDPDADNDGVLNEIDNCPWVFNRDQSDIDGDNDGDICDRDLDGDGRPNNRDNCPEAPNQLQTDTDGDTLGDLCDPDDDNDGVIDARDNCQLTPNPEQTDINDNNIGDACEQDADDDTIPDNVDNCPTTPNTPQADLDNDNIGDACDADDDGDFVVDERDNCPTIFNPRQEDDDDDGTGDVCELDADNDDVADDEDNCPETPNTQQADLDDDNIGDACDDDIDGDGLSQDVERALGTRINQPDSDGDGLLDGEEDLNADGVLSDDETDPTLWDSDGDLLSDGEERRFGTNPNSSDTDNDGVADGAEPGWNEDSDRDGLVNAADADSDNGSVADGDELALGRNMLDPTDDLIPPDTADSQPRCATSTHAAPHTPGAPTLFGLIALIGFITSRRTRDSIPRHDA